MILAIMHSIFSFFFLVSPFIQNFFLKLIFTFDNFCCALVHAFTFILVDNAQKKLVVGTQRHHRSSPLLAPSPLFIIITDYYCNYLSLLLTISKMPVSSAFYDDNISYFDDVSVPGQSSSNAVSLPSTDGNCFPLFDSLNAAALKYVVNSFFFKKTKIIGYFFRFCNLSFLTLDF